MKNHRTTLMAFAVASMAYLGWKEYDDYLKRAEPPITWFVVQNVSVADGKVDDDAIPVIYDRIIRKPFFGKWSAEIRNVETQSPVCFGDGQAFYEPKDTLPKAGVNLEWFMGRKCHLPAGQFYIETNYVIEPEGYPPKFYRATSNVFTIE